ncbi:glycoside hydrolase [Wilcoxina mikolae CBS 423.85]|nr:glycoside hydrolase [Wilcoxina mikolae CBS 423.85]
MFSLHSFLFAATTVFTVVNAADSHTPTPPMGWNSYNHYSCYVTEAQIRNNARALVDLGLAALGYEYVIPDCGWSSKQRTSDGKITWNTTFYPSGMPALGQYIHSLNLKFGVYSGAGTWECHPEGKNYLIQASLGHEMSDAQTFADWGADYLKYDNCWSDGNNNVIYYPNEDPSTRFRAMATALQAASRPIVYGICQWGIGDNLAQWAGNIGNSWRMSNDIINAWSSIYRITNQVVPLAKYAKPGNFNDMDMLMVGNGVLTPTESRTHFTIWAMEKSPLFIGAGLENHMLNADALKVFSNAEVIAINQDALGLAAQLVRRFTQEQYDIWSGPLSGGRIVVAIINWASFDQQITINLPDVGIQAANKARDVWAAQDLGRIEATYSAKVSGHGVKLLVLGDTTNAGTYTSSNGGTTFKNVYAATSSSAYMLSVSSPPSGSITLTIGTKQLTVTANGGNIGPIPLTAGLQDLTFSANVGTLTVTLPSSAMTVYPASSGSTVKVSSTVAGSKMVYVEYINYDLAFDSSWTGVGMNVLGATFSVNGGSGKTWKFPISGGSWSEVGKMRIQLDGFKVGSNTITISGVEGKLQIKGLEVWG